MHFLGIDLGWSSGESGLCCLTWQDGQLRLLDLQRAESKTDILTWVDQWLPLGQLGGIAVDAPTLIGNQTGMRLCDRLTHKHFGNYHAGSYPANLSLAFAEHTVSFGQSLEARGFIHAPQIVPQEPCRFQIEVFPHPAIVHLFALERILKYKKGAVAERRLELAKLRGLICDRLPQLEPALDITTSPLALPELPPARKSLKPLEDQLDSLICAYVAAHWWYWGTARNSVLGDIPEGYIVVPMPGER
jgi:predicted RNase H-like nuclease